MGGHEGKVNAMTDNNVTAICTLPEGRLWRLPWPLETLGEYGLDGLG
jgi:hypothetical protein